MDVSWRTARRLHCGSVTGRTYSRPLSLTRLAVADGLPREVQATIAAMTGTPAPTKRWHEQHRSLTERPSPIPATRNRETPAMRGAAARSRARRNAFGGSTSSGRSPSFPAAWMRFRSFQVYGNRIQKHWLRAIVQLEVAEFQLTGIGIVSYRPDPAPAIGPETGYASATSLVGRGFPRSPWVIDVWSEPLPISRPNIQAPNADDSARDPARYTGEQ
jgi:hypothetical protein